MSLTRKTSMRDAFAAKMRAKGQFSTFKRKPKAKVYRPSKRMRDYQKVRDTWMFDHPVCEVCKKATASDLHHKRGRAGKLLIATEFFLAACIPCHRDIHDYPNIARSKGLLAPANEWNVYPK